ncbi:branched-chain amino acid ABC transporter permease [Paucibacter sp. R3-3]|uniref:Branched-chain amino acid ABC transporter permease n=1 Tax=Roseateles agri TaxID=3098619 RepID=A0ABU5DP00_9BURK|nr:branched-chain amino acid ABC transporter permease [Paucibacter sp. R3-3]MDY0748045.1 branched-chain amino acid ABC transporter permease [Paucibacter sp. R3-3]
MFAAIALLCLLGPLLGDYPRYVVTLWLIYSMATLGMNYVMGFGKLYALGHGGFMLVGAYVVAAGINHWHWHPAVALAVSAVLAAAVGILIGLPAIRLKLLSLAIVTFAFASMLFQVVKSVDFLGGPQGLYIDASALPPQGSLTLWYVVVVLTVLALAMSHSLINSRSGRALLIIAVNEHVARSFGVNVTYHKLAAFAFAAVLGAVAGGLLGMVTGYVAPDTFNTDLSITIFAAVMIGGRGKLLGPFLGAAFIVALPELTQQARNLSQFIYAIAFLLIVSFFPDGLLGMVTAAWRKVARPTGTSASFKKLEESQS